MSLKRVKAAIVASQNAQPVGGIARSVSMKAATMIAANPFDPHISSKAVESSPYNWDYFLREFKKRVGRTPRKYQELKRMERAMHFLEAGMPVAAAAAEIGYGDPYYFPVCFAARLGSVRATMSGVCVKADMAD